ncbi:MAG: hypothetical protein JWR69_2621 [Pedosphaera sp.]|nr:hypothetical protein [Pedosphaera sp.]
MKPFFYRARPWLLAAIFAACVPGLAHAQSYNMDWFTVDGGGGTSIGGAFSISGTIGQPDAGVLSGGGFTVEGGFWSGISVIQSSGAPILSIQLVGSSAILSWPVGVAGFSLEETATPGNGPWSPTPQPVLDTVANHTVTVPAVNLIKVFRLRK